jgi:putative transposase
MNPYHTEFFTATILHWHHLLKDDNCKQIIVDSLAWLTSEKRSKIYAFVIIPNHIHLLWQIVEKYKREEVQGALISYTAHAFKKYLKQYYPTILEKHYVNKVDRSYQFWQRTPMAKECWSENFMLQKLNYIHNNPCQPHWHLAALPENYRWSSAAFYELNIHDPYTWLTHYRD